MKCIDLEALLCDYVDGTIAGPERATVELHLKSCTSCSELVADARAAIAFFERVPEVEPPAALVNGILFEARGGRAAVSKPKGWKRYLRGLIEPVLQPRFAMGMAMTILSFSMLGRFAGIPARQLKPADLEPAKIWMAMDDKLHVTWERAVKYYQSLRVVYEVQSTLKDWNELEEDKTGAAKPATPAEEPIQKSTQGEKPVNGKDGRAIK